MKKVLLKLSALVLLLTCSVGMWAQQSGTFRIKNVSTNLYFQINASGNATINVLDESSTAQQFVLELAGNDQYYLKSESGYYLQASGNWNTAAASTADGNCKIALVSQGDGTYGIQTIKGFCGTDKTESGSSIYSNKAVSNNGKWEIETITDFKFLVDADGDYTIAVSGNNYSDGQKVSASKLLSASDIVLPSVSGYDLIALIKGFSIVVNSYQTAGSVIEKQISAIAAEPSKSIVPAEWYIVKQSRDGVSPIYDNYSGSSQVMRAATTDQGPAVYDEITSSNAKYLVRFLPSIGNSYMIQFATGNYFKNDAGHVYLANTIATAGNFLVYATAENVFAINYTSDGKSYGKKVDNNGAGKNVDYWESGTNTNTDFAKSNNIWQLYAVTLSENIPLVDVVYQYTYDNEVKFSETCKAEVGKALPTPTLNKFGVDYTAPSGTVTGEETIDIPVSYDLPFAMADSYAHITQWYTVSFHMGDNLRYMYYSDGIEFATSNDRTNVNYMWAFVGNPFDGFQIYNKAAGSSVALDSNNPCGLSSDGENCHWKVYAPKPSVNGFCIKVDGQDYANLQSGSLKRWSDNDNGSTAQVIAAAMPISDFVNNKAFQAVAPRATLRADGTQLLTQTTGNDASSDELFAVIKSDKGNYYLYSIGAQKFVTYTGQNVGDVSLVESGMKSVTVTTDGKAGSPYRFKFQSNYLNINGDKNVLISNWSAVDDGNSFQFIDKGAYDLSDAIAAVDNYESPTKTLTDYGYATLFTDHAVAIPEGATAYYVTVDGTTATLNEIEDVIPANTGVVVKGTASSDYQFEYTTAAATTDVSDNKMVGYIVDTPITGDDAISYYAVNYKTVNSEKVPGFFAPKGATTPTGNFTAKAGKAYLKVEGAAGSSIVMRFGDATMVENLLKTQDAAIYDLTGRKVAQPERGIYIVNGKKMFFK